MNDYSDQFLGELFIDVIQQLKMATDNPYAVKTILILSLIKLIFLIITIILLVAFQMTGYAHQNIPPNSVSLYHQLKLESSNNALRINIFTTLFALLLTIIILILMHRKKISIIAGTQQQFETFYLIINPLSSVLVIFLLTNCMRVADVLMTNNQFQFIKKDSIIIVLIISSVLMLAGFLQWLTIVRYLIQTNRVKEIIQIVGSRRQKQQQVFQVFEKDYLSNARSNRNQLNELLNKQHPSSLYSNIRYNMQQFKQNSRQNHQQKTQSQFKNKELSKFDHKTFAQPEFRLLGGAQGGQKSTQNNKEQNNNNSLKIEQQLVLSQKFDENDFELEQNLLNSMNNDQDEDLSPYEINQIMRFTKQQFQLNKNTENNIILSKSYNPYKIIVNFMKIKQFKANIQKNSVFFEQKNTQNAHQQAERQKQANNDQQKPIDAQISILLKTILFNNSPFYIKERPVTQTECPIQKYIDANEHLLVRKPQDTIQDTNKKGQFAQEVLAFYKKRKNNGDDEQHKKDLTAQFTNIEYILAKRKFLFGNQQNINLLMAKQKPKSEYYTKNPLKRKLINYIRSKYED